MSKTVLINIHGIYESLSLNLTGGGTTGHAGQVDELERHMPNGSEGCIYAHIVSL